MARNMTKVFELTQKGAVCFNEDPETFVSQTSKYIAILSKSRVVFCFCNKKINHSFREITKQYSTY